MSVDRDQTVTRNEQNTPYETGTDMHFEVTQSSVGGSIWITTSKSHTLRAVLLASLGNGISHVRHILPSPDTDAMIRACSAFGATIVRDGTDLRITGFAGTPSIPRQIIDVGNSGQVLRFGAAISALIPHYSVFTGDESIRSLRPMTPLLDALRQLGAFAESSKGDGYAPVIIKGPIHAGHVVMDGQDSQPVSAMLMLAAYLEGETTLEVREAGEKPWINLTLHWLDRMGVGYENRKYEVYTVYGRRGGGKFSPFDYTVPGDWSSAAFPLAAALLCNCELTLENMDIQDPQGDKAILDIFRAMGAVIDVDVSGKKVMVRQHDGLRGITVDVNAVIDAVPMLAALACFAQSPTTIIGAAIARHKESDRLTAIATELAAMGGRIEEFDDGLTVYPTALHGARVDSRHDHRIAMALAVAALRCGDTIVENTDCVTKSFPGFATSMAGIGAAITEKI